MSKKIIERRFTSKEIELRAESQGDEPSLVGYAAVFNSLSEDLGGFRETVMPGAFARSLREGADCKFLMNHDPSLVMGRVKNKTLQLEEDARGLKFRVKLPPTQAGKDLYALVQRGDIDQCSFAFTVRDQMWEDVRDGNGDMYANRKLMDVDLLDTSAVTYPAYSSTDVQARELFPDGEPVEVRTAIENIKAKRGSGTDVDSMTMAEAHTKAAKLHASKSEKERAAGNAEASAAHRAAADAHLIASDSNKKADDAEKAAMDRSGMAISSISSKTSTHKELSTVHQSAADAHRGADAAVTKAVNDSIDAWGKTDKAKATSQQGRSEDEDDKDIRTLHEAADKVLTEEVRIEARIYKSESEVPDYVPADKKAQWKEVWNSAYKAAKKSKMSDADAEAKAFAEANGVAGPKSKKRQDATTDEVSDPDSPDYDPNDPDFDATWSRSQDDAAGKTRTISGKVLHAGDFAFVGDLNDPSTWKLPTDSEEHTRRSLGRFGQVKGIPPEQKETVWKRLVTDCKKFSIIVSEEDSLRVGISHDVAKGIIDVLSPEQEAEIRASLLARVRCIEIDLN